MSKAVTETICTTCKHLYVCKFCEDVMNVYKQISDIHIADEKPYRITIICYRCEKKQLYYNTIEEDIIICKIKIYITVK